MTSSQVTASSSLDAIAAAARATLHTLNIPGRERRSERAQKARPKFAHTSATKQTVTGKPQVTVFAPSTSLTTARHRPVRKEEPPRPAGAADRGTARHPAATRGPHLFAHADTTTTKTDSKTDTEHQNHNTTASHKHLKSLVLALGAASRGLSKVRRFRSRPLTHVALRYWRIFRLVNLCRM